MKKDNLGPSKPRDIIDEASIGSFPTSDPPSWTLGTDKEVSDYLQQEQHFLTKQLADDHALIRHIIKLISTIATNIEQNKKVDGAALPIVCDILSIFLDKIHSQKEESLYPELLQNNSRLTPYMLNNLRDEHAQGRQLISQLNTLCQNQEWNKKESCSQISSLLKEISHLYTTHLIKEDEYILPHIKNSITESNQSNFIEAFQLIEKKYHNKQDILNKISKEKDKI